ncbi:MAG TPA: UbiA family prenyltransferase [Verrucomicrobiae bacterium]
MIFILKTARPGFWLTSVWFYLLPIAQQQVFASPRFWVGLIFVTFPFGLLIYGWNDIMDAEVDRFNARKDTFLFGARGTAQELQWLPWIILLAQLPWAAVFISLEGPQMVAWYAALVLATAVYNLPGIGFKNFPVLDMLNQLGYLLVFWLSSRLNHVPQLAWPAFVFGGLFAIHSHLLGQIMDATVDKQAGRKTTALTVGIVPAKCLLMLFLAVEAGLVFYFFGDRMVAAFLLAGMAWFSLDAFFVFRERAYPLWFTRGILLGWNGMAIGSAWWVWSRGTFSHVRT